MKNFVKNLIGNKWFSIVMVVLFLPLGLFLVWRNSEFKKKTKVLLSIAGVLVFFFRFGTVEPTTPPATEDKPTANVEVQEEVKEEPKAPELTEEEKKAQAEAYERTTFKSDLKALDNVEFELYDGGDLNINFDLSDNLTTKMTLTGYYMDLKNTCKELKDNSTIDKYDSITFTAWTDFVNSYGETNRGKAISATIKVSDIKRVQYDNITTDQFKNIVDTTFTHPALLK